MLASRPFVGALTADVGNRGADRWLLAGGGILRGARAAFSWSTASSGLKKAESAAASRRCSTGLPRRLSQHKFQADTRQRACSAHGRTDGNHPCQTNTRTDFLRGRPPDGPGSGGRSGARIAADAHQDCGRRPVASSCRKSSDQCTAGCRRRGDAGGPGTQTRFARMPDIPRPWQIGSALHRLKVPARPATGDRPRQQAGGHLRAGSGRICTCAGCGGRWGRTAHHRELMTAARTSIPRRPARSMPWDTAHRRARILLASWRKVRGVRRRQTTRSTRPFASFIRTQQQWQHRAGHLSLYADRSTGIPPGDVARTRSTRQRRFTLSPELPFWQRNTCALLRLINLCGRHQTFTRVLYTGQLLRTTGKPSSTCRLLQRSAQ